MHPQKVICQKLLQISSIEEGKDKFSTLVLPITFFLANFLPFSQRFRNQREILRYFDTQTQIF